MIPQFFRSVNRNLCDLLPSIQPVRILHFVFLQEYLHFPIRHFLFFQRVSTGFSCQRQKTAKFCLIYFYKNYTLSQNFYGFFQGAQTHMVYVIFRKEILYQKLFTFSTWFSTFAQPLIYQGLEEYCIFLEFPVMKVSHICITGFHFT